MGKVVITEGQSLLDLCLQELGDVAPAFDLADANGLAITDELEPGQQLVVPESLLGQPVIAAYFARRKQRINTGNDAAESQSVAPVETSYFNSNFFNPDYHA